MFPQSILPVEIMSFKRNSPNLLRLIFSCSGGPSSAVQAAAIGAVLLALIEGVGIAITRMTAEQFKPGKVMHDEGQDCILNLL